MWLRTTLFQIAHVYLVWRWRRKHDFISHLTDDCVVVFCFNMYMPVGERIFFAFFSLSLPCLCQPHSFFRDTLSVSSSDLRKCGYPQISIRRSTSAHLALPKACRPGMLVNVLGYLHSLKFNTRYITQYIWEWR